MVNYNLDPDEGIMLEESCVSWFGGDGAEVVLETLALTNKRLFLVYEKSGGLFSKTETVVVGHPHSDIKVVDGQPLIDQVENEDYGLVLQIQYMNGREQFLFESEKKTTPIWYSEIYKLLTGTEPAVKSETVNYNLDPDEGIMLEETRVRWFCDGNDDLTLKTLSLTNKRLFLVYEKDSGQYSKSETILVEHPHSDIKIINGQPLVDQVKNDYGLVLQIQYMSGREQFLFESKKKATPIWHSAIYKLLTGTEPSVKEKNAPPKAFAAIGSGLGGFAAGIKNVAESAAQSMSDGARKVANQTTGSFAEKSIQAQEEKIERVDMQGEVKQTHEGTSASNSSIETNSAHVQPQNAQWKFCSNCGTKIASGAKFCSGCGAQIGGGSKPVTPPPVTPPPVTQPVTPSPVQAAKPSNPRERQQEFAGTVLKCPNCGTLINQTTVICPACSYQITGRAAIGSVMEFNNQLMSIEMTRKASKLGIFAVYGPADPVDKSKLSLIRSFPIPNTIDDIMEFMMLAVSNIDVAVSGRGGYNRPTTEWLAEGMPRAISNAWVAKMEQAYQKAKTLFPNDPAFETIKRLYVNKMGELRIKIKE